MEVQRGLRDQGTFPQEEDKMAGCTERGVSGTL